MVLQTKYQVEQCIYVCEVQHSTYRNTQQCTLGTKTRHRINKNAASRFFLKMPMYTRRTHAETTYEGHMRTEARSHVKKKEHWTHEFRSNF